MRKTSVTRRGLSWLAEGLVVSALKRGLFYLCCRQEKSQYIHRNVTRAMNVTRTVGGDAGSAPHFRAPCRDGLGSNSWAHRASHGRPGQERCAAPHCTGAWRNTGQQQLLQLHTLLHLGRISYPYAELIKRTNTTYTQSILPTRKKVEEPVSKGERISINR